MKVLYFDIIQDSTLVIHLTSPRCWVNFGQIFLANSYYALQSLQTCAFEKIFDSPFL